MQKDRANVLCKSVSIEIWPIESDQIWKFLDVKVFFLIFSSFFDFNIVLCWRGEGRKKFVFVIVVVQCAVLESGTVVESHFLWVSSCLMENSIKFLPLKVSFGCESYLVEILISRHVIYETLIQFWKKIFLNRCKNQRKNLKISCDSFLWQNFIESIQLE